MSRVILTLLGVLVGVLPAAGQSLAEAAAKERERRARKEEPAKVYTKEDLEKAGEGDGVVTTPLVEGAPIRSRSGGSARGESEGSGPGDDEATWRDRVRTARQAIVAAETAVEEARQRLTAVQQDRNPTGDVMNPYREQTRQQQVDAAREGLEEAEASLEEARRDLAGLRERARREGVPPGWLR